MRKKITQRNQIGTLDRDNNNKYGKKKLSKKFNSRVNRVGEKIGDLGDRAAEIKSDQDALRENGKQTRTRSETCAGSQMIDIPVMGAPEGEEREKQAGKMKK